MITNEEAIVADSSTNVDPPITGSPIIIGGGGGVDNKTVTCKFEGDVYKGQASGLRTRFVSDPPKQLKKLKLTIDGKPIDLSSFVPETGDGEIEIRCPGFNNDLKIFGNPLAVEFDTRTYKEEAQEPAKRVFKDDDSVVSKVKIEFPGFKLERKFTRNETLELEADYA